MLNWKSGTHMCMIHAGSRKAAETIIDFLTYAIHEQGTSHYFRHSSEAADIHNRLMGGGCGADTLHSQFSLYHSSEVYMKGGAFDVARMLDALSETYDRSLAAHSGPVHISGEMEWAACESTSTRKALIEYEHRVNHVCQHKPFSAICQYNTDQFSPEFLAEIVAAHPFLVVEGMIIPSPTYRASSSC